MQKVKIGVSGNRGSFSEEAARYYAGQNKIEQYEIVYLISVEGVLDALKNKKIFWGIFPIENSNGGVVIEAVQAMSKYIFQIKDMFEIDISHCLLAKQDLETEEIKKIISHPQALKQCRMYLKRKWGSIKIQEYSDTAQAAKDLSEGKIEENSAVIAPRACADLYGLKILETKIQDLKFNFTSFIVAE